MDVKIFAPLKARRGDVNVTPDVGVRRQLLAPLILQCGQVAAVSVLVDERWRTASPRDAMIIPRSRRDPSCGIDDASVDASTGSCHRSCKQSRAIRGCVSRRWGAVSLLEVNQR